MTGTVYTSSRERLAAGLGAVGVVALLGHVLLLGLGVHMRALSEHPIILLNLEPPPPSQQPRPKPPSRPAKISAASQAPSPPNLRNKATPIVAPPPLVPPPLAPPPVTVSIKAGTGMAAFTGASDQPGSGQGAGGAGEGTGGGGAGGVGGGDGDGHVPPRRIRGRLSFADLPAALREAGQGGSVGVRYYVNVDGRASGCAVTASSGDADLDATTCRLIEQRFRFDPSRDGNGRPVRSIVVERHSWEIDRDSPMPSQP